MEDYTIEIDIGNAPIEVHLPVVNNRVELNLSELVNELGFDEVDLDLDDIDVVEIHMEDIDEVDEFLHEQKKYDAEDDEFSYTQNVDEVELDDTELDDLDL